jgi:hypothetical protein
MYINIAGAVALSGSRSLALTTGGKMECVCV